MTAMPNADVDLICVTPGNPFMAVSMGYVMRRSTSSGAIPWASAKTGTIMGDMSGNASTGILVYR